MFANYQNVNHFIMVEYAEKASSKIYDKGTVSNNFTLAFLRKICIHVLKQIKCLYYR